MEFNKYAAKGNKMVEEIAWELGFPRDHKRAGRMLRSTLHALRDRLPVEQSFLFMAQLPFVIKALYVEGWKYTTKPYRMKHVDDFVQKIISEDYPLGEYDIRTPEDGERIVRAVFKVLKKYVSEGEIKDIQVTFPPELRTLWEDVPVSPT